jgi:hypothetical protein
VAGLILRSDATKNNSGCQRDGVYVGQQGLRRIALPSIAGGIARDVPAWCRRKWPYRGSHGAARE